MPHHARSPASPALPWQDWAPFRYRVEHTGGDFDRDALGFLVDEFLDPLEVVTPYFGDPSETRFLDPGWGMGWETNTRIEGDALKFAFNRWAQSRLVPVALAPQFIGRMQEQLARIGLLRGVYRPGVFDAPTHDALVRAFALVMPDEGFGEWTLRDNFADQAGALPLPFPGERISLVIFALIETLFSAWIRHNPARPAVHGASRCAHGCHGCPGVHGTASGCSERERIAQYLGVRPVAVGWQEPEDARRGLMGALVRWHDVEHGKGGQVVGQVGDAAPEYLRHGPVVSSPRRRPPAAHGVGEIMYPPPTPEGELGRQHVAARVVAVNTRDHVARVTTGRFDADVPYLNGTTWAQPQPGETGVVWLFSDRVAAYVPRTNPRGEWLTMDSQSIHNLAAERFPQLARWEGGASVGQATDPKVALRSLLRQAETVLARVRTGWAEATRTGIISDDTMSDIERLATLGDRALELFAARAREPRVEPSLREFTRNLRDITHWLRDEPDIVYATGLVGILRNVVDRGF